MKRFMVPAYQGRKGQKTETRLNFASVAASVVAALLLPALFINSQYI